jgi:hypothetical protein
MTVLDCTPTPTMLRVSSPRNAGTKLVVCDFFRNMLARCVAGAPRRNRKDPICFTRKAGG